MSTASQHGLKVPSESITAVDGRPLHSSLSHGQGALGGEANKPSSSSLEADNNKRRGSQGLLDYPPAAHLPLASLGVASKLVPARLLPRRRSLETCPEYLSKIDNKFIV